MIERRALLPRLIDLSIQSTSSLLKENVEANGLILSNSSSSELRHLLGRYASNLGCSFDDAIKMIVGISEGQRPLEVWFLYPTILFFLMLLHYWYFFGVYEHMIWEEILLSTNLMPYYCMVSICSFRLQNLYVIAYIPKTFYYFLSIIFLLENYFIRRSWE